MNSKQSIISLEAGWREIKERGMDRLEKIIEEDFKGPAFHPKEFAEIYTIVFEMCTQNNADNHSAFLYILQNKTISEYLHRCVLPDLNKYNDERLLKEFLLRYNNHQIMTNWNYKFFIFLERFYILTDPSLFSLTHNADVHFKTIVFDAKKTNITNALLKLINSNRDGNIVDVNIVQNIISIYKKMESLNEFEMALLLSTSVYYKKQTEVWMSENQFEEYALIIEKCIENENHQLDTYLITKEIKEKVLDIIYEDGVRKRTDYLLNDGKLFNNNPDLKEIGCIFRIFNRANMLEPMSELFKKHMDEVGKSIVSAMVTDSNSVSEKTEKTEKTEIIDDPHFIKNIIQMHEKYITICDNTFNKNPIFNTSILKSFNTIMNQTIDKHLMAEFLASFCDRLLTNGAEKMSETETSWYINKSIDIFAYIHDKDVFGLLYKNQLGKRLLNKRSASNEMERHVVSKLKIKYGAQYTSKLECMLNDNNVSEEQVDEFRKYFKEMSHGTTCENIDFGVQLLTQGNWPTYPNIPLKLPSNMQKCLDIYSALYNHKTPGRLLYNMYTLGHVIMKCSFGSKAYEITMSLLQSCVLTAFISEKESTIAQSESMSFKQLQDSMNISEEYLKRTLHSLVCGKFKILRKNASDPADEKKGSIKNMDTFQINTKFTSPVRKFRIPMASLEEHNDSRKIDEDRSFVVDASIVRIMKARKTMGHQMLLAEVATQLTFFKPDIKIIKKRIECLIERDYLMRDDENPGMYKYIA